MKGGSITMRELCPERILTICPECQGTGACMVTILDTETTMQAPCTACFGFGRVWLTKEDADDDWRKETR